MKQLFLDIKQQLETLPDLQMVRLYNGQDQQIYNDSEENQLYAIPLPAAFIEFVNDQQVTRLGVGHQLYDPLIIRIHILHQQLDAGDGTMEQDLEVFDLAQKVFSVMQNFHPEKTIPFVRISETRDYEHRNVYHFMQDYTTNYVDSQEAEPQHGSIVDAPPIIVDTTIFIQNDVIRTGAKNDLPNG